MKSLIVGSLLWLHPLISNGVIEASSRPSLGVRDGTTVVGVHFEAAVGTDYAALRERVRVEDLEAETEHLWLGSREYEFWRATMPVNERKTIFFTMEYQLHKEPRWRDADLKGSVPVAIVRQEHFYWTWVGRTYVARAGLSQDGDVGFSFSAHW